MKIRLSFFLVLASGMLTGCLYVNDSRSHGYSSADYKAVTNITQSGVVPADVKRLEVDNRFGHVYVTGIDNGPGDWSWTLNVRALNDTLAQEAVEAASCSVVQTGSRLRLVVTLPDTDGKQIFQSDLEIRAPKSAAVHTQNRFGRTQIANFEGDVEATGQHGAMDLTTIGGSVQAQTSFGTLNVNSTGSATLCNHHGEIEALEVHGPLDAETSFAKVAARNIFGPIAVRNQHGPVEVANVGGHANLSTSFAGLKAEGIEGDAELTNQHGRVAAKGVTGSIRASTSFETIDITAGGSDFTCRNQHGSIRLQATSPTLKMIEANTSFGSLEVRLPASLKPAIQARTSFANIESDFPVLMKPRGEDPFANAAPDTPRITLQNDHGKIRVICEQE